MPKIKPDQPERRRNEVHSVGRALEVMSALSEDSEGMRLTDVVRRTGLSVSTTHRLLTTMQNNGFVQFDQNASLWHVGRRAFIAGNAYVTRHSFVAMALPHLRDLRDVTRETVNVGMAAGNDVIVLMQVESREVVRAATRTGGRVPLVRSGLGKALLAGATAEEFDQLTAEAPEIRARLQAQIDAMHRHGFVVDEGDLIGGLRCFAAPVRDASGRIAYAISVSADAERVSGDHAEALGAAVASTARTLTDALAGYALAG